MKRKLFVLVSFFTFLVSFADLSMSQTASRRAVTPSLVSLLPASDGVVTVDVNRFLNEAMPKLLSGNQPMFAKMTAHIEEMRAKTGLNLRDFETVAAGVNAIKAGEKNYDFDVVMIARSRVSAGAVVTAAKLATNGKYREEKIGSKTVYIFSASQVADKHTGKIEKALGASNAEMAVTVLDTNTIAFGSATRVRETAEAKSRLSLELAVPLGKNGTSVMAFAAKLPEGMSAFLPMENDELGKNIDSIKYMYGSMNVVGDSATLHVTARTLRDAQAASLKDTLEGLQLLGKALLGGAKAPDKQVYARMIENAKFTAKGNEVMLDLQVLQADIDVLVGKLK